MLANGAMRMSERGISSHNILEERLRDEPKNVSQQNKLEFVASRNGLCFFRRGSINCEKIVTL